MYTYNTFNGLDLPDVSIKQKIGSMDTANSLMTVGGGASFDALGSDDAPSVPKTVTLTATLKRNSKTELETVVRELTALRGKAGKLTRRWENSRDQQEIQARCLSVTAAASYTSNKFVKAVQFKSQLLEDVWITRDPEEWNFDEGYLLGQEAPWGGDLAFDSEPLPAYDSTMIFIGNVNPQSFTVTNDGNADFNGAIVTLSASGISLPTNAIGLILKKTSGTPQHIILDAAAMVKIPTSSTVARPIVINSALSTVEQVWFANPDYDRANIYSDFSLGSEHESENWITLEPGVNTFTLEGSVYTEDFSVGIHISRATAWQ